MPRWASLYLPSPDSGPVIAALRESLDALGYTLFDPFDLLPGKAYPNAVRLFVAPPLGGWVRVIGEADARLYPHLSTAAPCLTLALEGSAADIQFWRDGAAQGIEALAPYLRPGKTPDDLRRALVVPVAAGDTGPSDGLPLDALPDDVQSLARGVDLAKAQSLFDRLAGNAMRRAGGKADSADAARALIAAGNPPDWDSPGGRQIRALVSCLTIPDGWQTPDFLTARDAYQAHLRRQRRPDAPLFPGDAEAMRRVSDALSYTPVFGGSGA